MKRVKKFLITLMVAALMVSLAAPALAQSAASDIAGHWAEDSIVRWQANGVIQGYPDGTFQPNKPVTRAEFVTILNGIFGFYAEADQAFADVLAGAWYAKGLSVAREAGYYEGFPGNLARPSAAISRQDAVTLLARMFALEPEEGAETDFADQDEIASYAAGAVQALAGYVSGYRDGTFRPTGEITRAEVVQLIDQLVTGYYAEAGEVEGGTIAGNAVINHEDVLLKDAAVAGNLYIAPGVADGDADLDKVAVDGTTFIAGGGMNSVSASDSTFANVVIERKEGNVRFQTSGQTSMESISVHSPATIELGEGTSVKKMTIHADGTRIIGEVDIELLVVEADGVTVNGKPVERGETSVGGGAVGVVPGGAAGGGSGSGGSRDRGSDAIDLADKDATDMTKSLFAYLSDIQGEHIIFGQQHVTDEALSDAKNADGVVSDVYNSVGDYPGLFGWDTLSLDGYEKPGSDNEPEASDVEALIAEMKLAHELGGILTLSTHPHNFVTGGNFNDVTGDVVAKILPGGSHNAEFNAWLDNIEAFANGLVDDEGNPIPVLFRPFHEQSGGWFWWGTTETSVDEYKELYRYTVEYLRDKKNVHNFLYVYSPNGPFGGSAERYLTWYPGDDYVDVVGLDQYDSKDNAGSEGFLNALVEDLAMISRLAEDTGKISVFSEFGYSPQGMNISGNNPVWFTSMLDAIKSDPDARKIAYMQTWANFGFPNNIFVPYHDVKLIDPDTNEPYGDSDLLPDFIDYYEDDYTAFARDLVGVYDYEVNVRQDEDSFLHVVSPIDQATLKEESLTIRARALNADDARVTYSVNGSEEVEMTLDEEGFYYIGSWTPDAEDNTGGVAELTVRLYEGGAVTHESTKLVQVQVPEILIDTYTFDEDLQGVQYAGAYYNAIGGDPGTGSIGHAVVDGNGVLQLNVTDMVYTDSWQELKLELKELDEPVLRLTNRVKFDVMVPTEAASKSADAQVQGVGLLPPDYGTKYEAAGALLSSLTVTGDVYQYEAVVTFPQPQKLEEAEGIALSIIGKYLEHEGPIYVDNIAFYRAFVDEPEDPAIVDTFDGYQGLDSLLQNTYTAAGDNPVVLSLSPDVKGGGHFGLRYEYDLDREYVGITKAMDTDWSAFNKLRFWMKPDGSGQKLVLQFTFGGIAYEAYPSIEGTEAGWVEVHLNDFVPAEWEEAHQGRALTKSDLQDVTKFGLFINLQPGESDRPASVIYIDEIQAIYDETADEVPGSGPPALEAGLINDFEEDRGGWAIENDVNNANARDLAISTDDPASGASSLSVTFDLEGTDFEVARVEGLNISKVDTLQLKAKLSSGSADAVLYLKDGSYGWHAAESTALSAESYTTLSLPISEIPEPEAIYSIGLKLSGIAGTGTARLYIDDVELLAEGSGMEAGILHDFESDVEGWEATNASGGPWVADEWAASGSQSLKADIPLGAELKVELKSTANLDLTGLSTLKAQVKQAAWGDAGSGIKAKLFVKTGADFAWFDSGEVVIGSDSATELAIDLSSVADLDQVKEIGIEFLVPADSADSTAVYVDHVVVE